MDPLIYLFITQRDAHLVKNCYIMLVEQTFFDNFCKLTMFRTINQQNTLKQLVVNQYLKMAEYILIRFFVNA